MGFLNDIHKKRKRNKTHLYLGDLVSYEEGANEEVVGIYQYDNFYKKVNKGRTALTLGTYNAITEAMIDSVSFRCIEISEREKEKSFCVVYRDKGGNHSWNRFSKSIRIKKLGE
jgi:anti-sigma regulatory factor (Ser/Thr protein kinase)